MGIRLLSFGDDRGHSGEQHGCSTVTTERGRDDSGQFVGSKKNLKHKKTCDTWGDLAVKARPETAGENQVRELARPARARVSIPESPIKQFRKHLKAPPS